jgi:HK97 family phage portal protein
MKILGINLFQSRVREVKASQSQAVAMLMYVGQDVVWMKKNLGVFATEGYMACVDAYACIDLIAKSLSSIPIIMERPATSPDGESERIESHTALDLLERPNPGQGQGAFIDAVVRNLLIAGNSYIEAAGPAQGGPHELYAMKPNRVSVLVGSQAEPIKGYRYTAGSAKKDFLASQVLHLKFFNPDPNEDFYGLAPIEIAARAIDTSNLALASNAKLCKNNFQPPGAFLIEREMTPLQEKDFIGYIKDSYTGDNSFLPLVLTGGKDYKQLAISPKDADFIGLDALTTRKICRVFNVAPELIGDPANKTYSNYQEARLALYMETCMPLAQWIMDELNNWLMPKFEGRPTQPGALRSKPTLRLKWDFDKIPALQEKRQEMFSKLDGAWWMEINERRKACGLGDWENGEGNVLMIPMGLTPYGENVEEEPEPEVVVVPGTPVDKPPVAPGDKPVPPPEEVPEGLQKPRKSQPTNKASYWTDPERKAKLWESFDRRLAMQERQIVPLIKKYLRQQAARIKAAFEAGATPTRLIDIDAEVTAYAKRFFPYYERAFRFAGQAGFHATQGKLYDPTEDVKAEADKFIVDPEMLKKLRDQIAKSAKYFNETTGDYVKTFIEDAAIENLTTEQVTQELWKALGDRAAWEARRIAATEMTRTDGWGSVEGYKQNDTIDSKGWNCQKLENSREPHVEADGQEVTVDEDFEIGGEAMAWPGDDRASASNVCNCRCSTYPVVGGLT